MGWQTVRIGNTRDKTNITSWASTKIHKMHIFNKVKYDIGSYFRHFERYTAFRKWKF